MSAKTSDEISAKQRMRQVIDEQPDDASYEELLRELAFNRMVESGLADVRSGDTLDHDEAMRKIRSWRN